MKIYKVYASKEACLLWDGNWWDEYLGHVVVADNEEEAIQIACEKGLVIPREQATVEEVLPLKKGIVLSDFNAG